VVQPGRRYSREDSEQNAMAKESCSRLQPPQSHNFQIPHTELHLVEKTKKNGCRKDMDLPKYRQGLDRNYEEKNLNTIKPVNSLYILGSENSTYQYFPALLNGLKRKPP